VKVVQRPAALRLRPFVKTIWASSETAEDVRARPARERVLPSGDMHLVFRLSDHPLEVFADADTRTGTTFAHAVVGGARSGAYVREVSEPLCSVGAELRPGASEALFGVPADELAERHTSLADLWGHAAGEARERFLEAEGLEERIALFEHLLAGRLPRVQGVHPAVAAALERFSVTDDVDEAVRESGYSHRRFIALFRSAVGLAPKLYCRVRRFYSAVGRLAAEPSAGLVDVALDAGYADQPHLSRDFREFSGVTPGAYRRIAPSSPHHVPIPRSRR